MILLPKFYTYAILCFCCMLAEHSMKQRFNFVDLANISTHISRQLWITVSSLKIDLN